MKQWITKEQVMELSPDARQRLSKWFDEAMPYDDCLARVFIPEERDGEFGGEFSGLWDSEHEFCYPEECTGKLKNHQGTILPLLDIGQMMEIMHESQFSLSIALPVSQVTLTLEIADDVCDQFWHMTKMLLEREEE